MSAGVLNQCICGSTSFYLLIDSVQCVVCSMRSTMEKRCKHSVYTYCKQCAVEEIRLIDYPVYPEDFSNEL